MRCSTGSASLPARARAIAASDLDVFVLDLDTRGGLAIARDLGYRELIAYHLSGLGQVAAARVELERAARLLGAARQISDQLGVPLQGMEQRQFDRTASALRTLLGEQATPDATADAPTTAAHAPSVPEPGTPPGLGDPANPDTAGGLADSTED
jgi:hypothetical protein